MLLPTGTNYWCVIKKTFLKKSSRYLYKELKISISNIFPQTGNNDTLLGNYRQFVCHLFVCLSPVCFSRPWPTKYMYKWNCMNKYIQKTMSRPTKFSTCQNLAKYVILKSWVGAKRYVY